MRYDCILDLEIPIWRVYFTNELIIPTDFEFNGKNYNNGITIVYFAWDLFWIFEQDKRIYKDEKTNVDINIEVINKLPNPILCCNDEKEVVLMNKLKSLNIINDNIVIECINQNAFIDENNFEVSDCDKQFDLIINSCFCSYKRRNLAKLIKNTVHIGYFQDFNKCIPAWGKIANIFNECGEPIFLSPDEIKYYYSISKVGGIFSEVEGACYSSSEYLLSGLPVISTYSIGGRDVWYNSENSVVCEPDESKILNAFEEALVKLNNGTFNPKKIREDHIKQMEEYREKLYNIILKILGKLKICLTDTDKKNLKYKLKYYYYRMKHNDIFKEIKIN